MCGRFVLFDEMENEELGRIIDEIDDKYNQKDSLKLKMGEIFPTNYAPVITKSLEINNMDYNFATPCMNPMKGPQKSPSNLFQTTKDERNRAVNLFKWGFPNFKSNGVIINARSETLEEKPTFRKILFSKRCLIPASGFYEWKPIDGKKDKYLIRTQNPLFYMAGLYNDFIGKDGTPFTGFVVITTDANEEMSAIHNRMPVILEKDAGELWLGDRVKDALGLLSPYRASLEFTKVE